MKGSLLGLMLRLAVAALLAIFLCGSAAAPESAPVGAFSVTSAQQSAVPVVSLAASSATRAHPGVNGNPWGYNYSCCRLITHPPRAICHYFHCIPSFRRQTRGYVEQCQDGTISHSGGRRGSCSSHGGNLRPLYRP